jgi:hypothetical protein
MECVSYIILHIFTWQEEQEGQSIFVCNMIMYKQVIFSRVASMSASNKTLLSLLIQLWSNQTDCYVYLVETRGMIEVQA